MSGFDLADLFANWHFGAIIKRKPREGGMGGPTRDLAAWGSCKASLAASGLNLFCHVG